MANSAGMALNFKKEVMMGIHAFGPGTGVPARTSAGVADVLKLALFLSTATRVPADATYNTTGELAASGNYTQGGKTLTQAAAPTLASTTGIFTPSASPTWTALTSSGAFNCAVLYNDTQSDKQIAVFTFTEQNIAAADFTLTMPANASGTALIRFA